MSGNYTTSHSNANDKLRKLSYRANIPFYILFDTDLDGHHYRLYGLIEQLESNPNPKVTASFSYAYFAEVIGVEIRWAKRIAKKLKDKKYISHTQLSNGKWIWNTVKNSVILSDEGGVVAGHGGVSSETTGGVSSETTQNTYRESHIEEVCGETSSHTQISSSFSTDKDKVEKNAYNNEELKKSFDLKFKGYSLTYDELFATCKEHYEQKSLWVTVSKWKNWIHREKLDNHHKLDSNVKKPLTEKEISMREISNAYNEYVQRIKHDRILKLESGNGEIMTFEQWRKVNKK